jgi:hypothetical protein
VTKQILVDLDEYVGAVKVDGEWRFFHDVLSMWILNYPAYDSGYIPKPGDWREKILKVGKDNAKQYCEALAAKEIPAHLIPNTISVLDGQMPLTFVVNFDERLFINGWHDNIPIHEYAPDGWKAMEDDPYSYIPQALKALWSK